MSWSRLVGRLSGAEPEPDCPPNCVKCAESESIDPDYTPDGEE
ncbi:hypothetical protein [Streptomyces sp. NPDC051132]